MDSEVQVNRVMHIQKMIVIYESVEEVRNEEQKVAAGFKCISVTGYRDGHVKIEYEKEDYGKKGGTA